MHRSERIRRVSNSEVWQGSGIFPTALSVSDRALDLLRPGISEQGSFTGHLGHCRGSAVSRDFLEEAVISAILIVLYAL